MGRLTYEREYLAPNGLFEKLENEGHKIIKIVLTSSEKYESDLTKNIFFCQNWSQVTDQVRNLNDKITEAWNIGGPYIYKTQMDNNIEKRQFHGKIYLTKLYATYDCDVFYPIEFSKQFKCVESSELLEENNIKLQFFTYELQIQ